LTLNLFNLQNHYLQIVNMANEMDEETLFDTLEGIQDAIEVKLENYVYVIRSIEAQNEAIAKEEERLAAYKKGNTATINRLKGAILEAVETLGESVPKSKSAAKRLNINSQFLKNITVQNNPAKVKIEDSKKLPGSYFKPQEPKIDSAMILKDLKAEKEVPGAIMIQERGLRIK
jgi:Siphovirus Gp157